LSRLWREEYVKAHLGGEALAFGWMSGYLLQFLGVCVGACVFGGTKIRGNFGILALLKNWRKK
jgi:hypothetical protein